MALGWSSRAHRALVSPFHTILSKAPIREQPWFWGTSTSSWTRCCWGRGHHPVEKGCSSCPHPCPLSHLLPSSPPPQLTANLHLSRLLQVPPAPLLLCLSHSRERCWGVGVITPGSPPSQPDACWGGWLAIWGGGPSSRPHPHPHGDLYSSLVTKSSPARAARPRWQGRLPQPTPPKMPSVGCPTEKRHF